MRTLLILLLFITASISDVQLTISQKSETKHFSMDGPAPVSFTISNRNADEVRISQFAIVDLKNDRGQEYTAPFNISTLKQMKNVKDAGRKLLRDQSITLTPDLTKLHWGNPNDHPPTPQQIKAVVQPGRYVLKLLVICNSCKPILQVSKGQEVTFF